MATAYSYIRFSTSEQKKGDSLRRQVELSEKYAEENGLILDHSLNMHDIGLSAFDRSNIERGALGGFLSAIKQGKVTPGSYLLVESLDRLSRDKVMAALKIFISILEYGVTIVTLADNMKYSSESVGDNFGSLIISITIMARAHEESAMKSRRLIAAWDNKRANIEKKKLTAQCPKWLRLNTEKTEFELIPERVKIVMEMIQLAKKGMGQAQIAKILNKRSEKLFSNHGNGWHASYVCKILTSPALYGEFQPRLWNSGKLTPYGDPIQNYYPPLIAKDEFFHLQSLRRDRLFSGSKARKGTGIPNLFSGVAKCGYCGSSMILVGAAAKRVRSEDGTKIVRPVKKVLVCDGARRGMGCFAVQWPYDEFEKNFLLFCKSIDLQQLLIASKEKNLKQDRMLSVVEQRQSTIATIEDAAKKLELLLQALEQGDPPKALLSRLHKIEAEIEALTEQKKQFDIEIQTIESLSKEEATDADLIRILVDELDSQTGDIRFHTRAALAEIIRRVLFQIQLFPAGTLVSKEKYNSYRTEIVELLTDEKINSISIEDVDQYLSRILKTEPVRTGRGIRGRFEPQNGNRYYSIITKSLDIKLVFPNKDDAGRANIDLSLGMINNKLQLLLDGDSKKLDGLKDLSRLVMSRFESNSKNENLDVCKRKKQEI